MLKLAQKEFQELMKQIKVNRNILPVTKRLKSIEIKILKKKKNIEILELKTISLIKMSLNNKMEISRKIISEAEMSQRKLSKECRENTLKT